MRKWQEPSRRWSGLFPLMYLGAILLSALPQAVEQLGPVGVLVNSAGVTFPAAFLDTPTLKFQVGPQRDIYIYMQRDHSTAGCSCHAPLVPLLQELYQTNVLGSVRVTRAVLPQMIRERRGRVVFISSQAGQCAVYGYSAYSATKFALRGLAECLQMEVKPFNVLISVSFPPDTDTPQLQEELETRVSQGVGLEVVLGEGHVAMVTHTANSSLLFTVGHRQCNYRELGSDAAGAGS